MEFDSISLRFAYEGMELDENSLPTVFSSFSHMTSFVFYRMKAEAVELKVKIEIVNRERKYHQQNIVFELNALSAQ
ncbi:unnamed protein product [Lactuca virosa]|uniref:Uncharacterized protein n=1 Tax=Lactuca virosa TaxID=75947 RepID=A0AAU9MES0_9ASTR|nr:unnamed protein product [Lactuca virosa]